jgi:hypothetical protein
MADVGPRRLEHADSESAVEPPDSAARSDDLQRDPRSGKFVRSFSERLRTYRSGQSLERLWTKIRITKLQGKMKINQRHLDFQFVSAMARQSIHQRAADLDQPSVVIQMNQIRLCDCRVPLGKISNNKQMGKRYACARPVWFPCNQATTLTAGICHVVSSSLADLH